MCLVLWIEELHAYYGESHVLRGVSLSVKPGQLVALLGRNGAGKTTTMRAISGALPPRCGRVKLGDVDITGATPERIARLGVSIVPQDRCVFPNLTVLENLTLGARKGSWDQDRALAQFPMLKGRLRNRGDQLSGGEQQAVAIARALLMNPDVLLLDEPSEGLAPAILREIGRLLNQLTEDGMAVILAEQNLPLALAAADEVYIMSKGRIVHQCSPASLDADEGMKRVYLGI